MPFAELSEVRTFFTDEGCAATPIVLVHGWTCDSHDWSWQLPAFSQRHRVIALDVRGHGRSSVPAKGWDPRTMAGDCAELIELLNCGPVIIVGHSMGALIASALAIQRPELVRGVVSVDPAYGVAGAAADMIAGLYDIFRSEAGPVVAAGALGGVEGSETSQALRAWHSRRVLGTNPHVLAEAFNGMYEPTDQFGFRDASTHYLARRGCPVLAFHQSGDAARWEDSIANNPYSRTVVWEGVGHWLHQVRPDLFNELALDWIAGLPAGADQNSPMAADHAVQ